MELGGIGIGIGIDKMELTPCLLWPIITIMVTNCHEHRSRVIIYIANGLTGCLLLK